MSEFPVRAAAIDIGSNAIRLIAARFRDPQKWRVLEQVRTPVRLGHEAFVTGRLAAAEMTAALAALGEYAQLLERRRVTQVRAVATSAVRESSNGPEFVQRAAAEAGIVIEVISGEAEARLVHIGVRDRFDLGGAEWVLVDLGGGSVEVSVVDDVGVRWSVSHRLGSVRLLEEMTASADEPAQFRRRVDEYAESLQIPPQSHGDLAGFIATGGNIEALARLAGCEPDERGACILPLHELRVLIEQLSSMSYAERMQELALREDRADVILPAAMVYERICELSGFEMIHVPNTGLKDGVLLELVRS